MSDYLQKIEDEAERLEREERAEHGRRVCPADWRSVRATKPDKHGGYSLVETGTGQVLRHFGTHIEARAAHAALFARSEKLQSELDELNAALRQQK